MSHPVTWFQISGGNPGLAAFYKKVFGWKMTSMKGAPMKMIAPEPGGIAGGVGPSQDGKSSVAVYANTASIEKALKKAESAGGRTAMPIVDLPDNMGRISGFTDLDGNFMGLWQPGKAAGGGAKKTAKKTAKKPAKKATKKRR
jgi:predicted enzyme related to lactoylglutathione lyase